MTVAAEAATGSVFSCLRCSARLMKSTLSVLRAAARRSSRGAPRWASAAGATVRREERPAVRGASRARRSWLHTGRKAAARRHSLKAAWRRRERGDGGGPTDKRTTRDGNLWQHACYSVCSSVNSSPHLLKCFDAICSFVQKLRISDQSSGTAEPKAVRCCVKVNAHMHFLCWWRKLTTAAFSYEADA
eukprot:IDg8120t1